MKYLIIDDTFWMKRALFFARKSLVLKKIPVAAILVNNNFEIGVGFNFSGFDCYSFCHAEINSLRQASFYSFNHVFKNVTLYVTLEPCLMCVSSIFFSGVKCIIFSAYIDRDEYKNVAKFKRFNNSLSFKGGLLKKESVFLLNKFFFTTNYPLIK